MPCPGVPEGAILGNWFMLHATLISTASTCLVVFRVTIYVILCSFLLLFTLPGKVLEGGPVLVHQRAST